MWRDVIGSFPTAEASGPADPVLLDRLERALGQPLPEDLRSLLMESDGVSDDYGTDVVWSAQRILDDNLSFRGNEQFRTLYMPFDSLMFFGDNGGGDQFAFVRAPKSDEVFVWDHETDSRRCVSPNLESYLRSALGSDGEDWYR
ncbi:SMI1/KNR4 family protein [Streptomyces sp. NPDC093991]|uniref:SMI1/KNR4 family protein n=1 Tax=unclassified Streptomyces TaxID=2593676 RepID=UPI003432889F